MPSTFNARDADAYERVMGRWSRRLAEKFLAFAGDPAGMRVLEIGCGTGSLTGHLLQSPAMMALTAIDIAESYVAFARARFADPRLRLATGDACQLAYPDASHDMTLSLLALHLMTDPGAALREMRRVTRPGGLVAGAVWDVAGGLPHARLFLDTAAMFDAAGAAMRARYLAVPLTRSGELAALWQSFGFCDVLQTEVAVRFDFEDFADYWGGFMTGEGTMGAYVASLSPRDCGALADHVRDAFTGGAADGPRSFVATAWMCRGTVALPG